MNSSWAMTSHIFHATTQTRMRISFNEVSPSNQPQEPVNPESLASAEDRGRRFPGTQQSTSIRNPRTPARSVFREEKRLKYGSETISEETTVMLQYHSRFETPTGIL